MQKPSALERLVLPLDVPDLADARAWITRMRGEVGVFKVGLELFTAAGADAVRAVHDAGARCFLDLKLHDIPATMARATEVTAKLGVRYLTVHASAGAAALRECVSASGETQLLAVTVLTSLGEDAIASIGWSGTARDAATRLAGLAYDAGVRGFVCSTHEVAELRKRVGAGSTLVVPGIRPSGTDVGDQARVATPRVAIEAGADLLVVGRPIRNAADPVAAARAIVREIADATA